MRRVNGNRRIYRTGPHGPREGGNHSEGRGAKGRLGSQERWGTREAGSEALEVGWLELDDRPELACPRDREVLDRGSEAAGKGG